MIRVPIRCGNVDDEVQAYVEAEFWSSLGPYPSPTPVRSAQGIFEGALFLFGDQRCEHLTIWWH
jgi:hypothetical protein